MMAIKALNGGDMSREHHRQLFMSEEDLYSYYTDVEDEITEIDSDEDDFDDDFDELEEDEDDLFEDYDFDDDYLYGDDIES